MNRILLARYLSQLGYQATLLENGRQALELLQGESFDLLLLDVEMPGMDGSQVLEQLQADPRLRDLPVIMLSARAGEEAAIDFGKPQRRARTPPTSALTYNCAAVRCQSQNATGMLAMLMARPASDRIMMRLRFHRSASAPAGKPRTGYGNRDRALASPAWTGEWVRASIRSG